MASALSFSLDLVVTESVEYVGATGRTVEYAAATGRDPKSGQTVKLMATKLLINGGSGTPAFQPLASALTANVQFDDALPGVPPANLTLQGVHDIASGAENGSVSAASPELSEYIGGTFTFSAGLLTIFPRDEARAAARVPESPRAAANAARG
jgi:hypothetical protein